jgi:Fe-S cluster biogenesis protein NfuA
MKFVADRLLLTGGLQVEYKSKAEAAGSSPLAEELFNFPFVTNVFIAHNFVTVTKDGTIDWDMIVMQLREYIRVWLMDNVIAVSTVPAELMSRSAGMIEEAKTGGSTPASVDRSKFKPSEYDDAIMALLEEFVRPAVEADGGAIDFVGYDEKKVFVEMKGSCAGCPSSSATLKGGIENLLKAKLPSVVEEVISV